MIIRKSKSEIAAMRHAGRIVAQTLKLIENEIRPGITTAELDAIAEKFIRKSGARPAFKGYRGYPATICASPNEVVVHGIPGSRELVEGDIISIDVGAELDGFYGDAAATFPVGKISEEAQRLIDVTKVSLLKGIEQCVEDNYLYDISYAVQSTVEAAGYSVVKEFVGHGIGRAMHEDPQIPNFGLPRRGPKIKLGMVFAIEPMVNIGGFKVDILADNWTVVTEDRSLSAHFEHTVAVTKQGPDVLTVL
ncbi:MAG: type I methionyl aminopeptidase [Candidatus Aquicultor secundus]|uniref:Methionine aminopeptidase n=1 Tax=Candidatus Aquicultor secundus TaxID=1973895 RepID=A0A2M7T9M0_9ACTN|nr:type I methionyl aminopeptidase [Candidatus Aquicultor secundus]NCO65249.1 type I methionyl aminopeptidase [Solirubrobacter sp.]OIO86238.1 MAG: type I methionyl aminopeptidase [Candidatus Aquicultor secundus]PIU26401.1 MAG: type I methionyl aminopeptidase [Candidatus Aquicultor secundus]PIW21431.1 MAG: type I methionyl aminopeptidase [Candidatus Aquicultor secundus]PIX52767.1 MAG: type I methionyl aminopeptidase [Candidatus Aquicultor secundus]